MYIFFIARFSTLGCFSTQVFLNRYQRAKSLSSPRLIVILVVMATAVAAFAAAASHDDPIIWEFELVVNGG